MTRYVAVVAILALIGLSLCESVSQAGPFRNRRQAQCSPPPSCCLPPPCIAMPSATATGLSGSLDELTKMVKDLKKIIEKKPVTDEKPIPADVAKIFEKIQNNTK